jgi:hypothetical protein
MQPPLPPLGTIQRSGCGYAWPYPLDRESQGTEQEDAGQEVRGMEEGAQVCACAPGSVGRRRRLNTINDEIGPEILSNAPRREVGISEDMADDVLTNRVAVGVDEMR